MYYAIHGEVHNPGAVRETFFLNALSESHHITHPATGDFLVDDIYTFEIGGKTKDFNQVKNTKNAYLAVEGIESGAGNRIPLWLFGFLY